MSSAAASSQLADQGEGRCALSGALTLGSVPWLWKELQVGGLLLQAREADLSGVTEADSAGLALLITWKAHCRRQGGELHFREPPQRLLALARLTGAEGLLGTA